MGKKLANLVLFVWAYAILALVIAIWQGLTFSEIITFLAKFGG